ncbi:MAG: adenylate/guanylate cyclase domain-containing protein [Treponema sp.]
MWLASYDGLIRFDGLTFTKFTKAEHGFTGLSPRVLCKGNDGSLWIGTNASGLYNYKNKKFIHYGVEAGLPNVSIRALRFDNNNNRLWVGTAGGLAYLSDEGQFVPLSDEVNNSLGTVSLVLPVKDSIWVGSNLNGIKVIKNGSLMDTSYLEGTETEIFSAGYLDFDNSIWLGTVSGLMYHIKNEQIEKIYNYEVMQSASINGFVRLKSGTMFVATYKGLGRFTQDGYDLFSEKKGLPDKVVSALCQDREGNLWVAMKHAGVGKFSRGKFLDITRAAYMPSESINSVLEDVDGNIWSTNDNGITCLQNTDISKERKAMINSLVARMKGVRVRQVREESDGSLYFATYSDDALLIFNKNGEIKTITKKDGLPNNRVRFSYRDAQGFLWIGTTAGPALYVSNKVIKISEEVLPNTFILCALRDHKGRLWIGTDGGGVARLSISEDKKDNISFKLDNVYNNENGLDGNIIFRITEDKAGNLWFSTSAGLTLYKDGRFYSANNALGYSDEQIFNVICDAFGNVWVIAPQELILVPLDVFIQAVQEDRLSKDIIRYNKLDGVTGQLVANSWLHLTADNKLFLPTSKGVSLCDPRYDISNTLPPPVVIENIVIDGKSFEATEEKLKVPATSKRISFKFTALSYTVPERVNFEYKLEGYDAKWISCGTKRDIAYTNLNPGSYIFKVRATNNDGIVNKNGFYVSFYKEAFFYQTVWFYVFLVLVIAGSVIIGVHIKIHSLRKKAEELNEIVNEKTKELAEEKEKSDSLLKNILPSPIIEELISTGKSKPRFYPAVSILFADLVNFTKWATDNSSEVVISKLNKIFTHFDEIMDKYGCERIKTLGDGYMACCGLRGETSHAERLCNAAIEILKSLDRLNEEAGSSFKIKIAIDSGSVTGGIVGEHKYIFDIFGDVVNTTFRLEAATTPMGCTISKHTASLLKGSFPLYKRPERLLKGKGLCESYYLIYKNTSIKTSIDLQAYCKQLVVYFKNKEYTQCRQLLSKIDTTLLEPEIADKIAMIRKICFQASN